MSISKGLKTFVIVAISLGVIAVTMAACTSTSMMTGMIGGGISLFSMIVLLISLGLSQLGCRRTEDDSEVGICLSMIMDSETDSDSATIFDGDTDTNTDTEIGVCLDISEDSENVCLSLMGTDVCLSPDSEFGICLDISDTESDVINIPEDTDSDFSVCLDIVYPETDSDSDIGMCLSIVPSDSDSSTGLEPMDTDSEVSVCLDIVDTEYSEADAGIDTATEVGICLEMPLDTEKSTEIGPCLSMPVDSEIDVCLSPPYDTEFDVCLTPITKMSPESDRLPVLEKGYVEALPSNTMVASRKEIIERLDTNGVLPKGIAARLGAGKNRKS